MFKKVRTLGPAIVATVSCAAFKRWISVNILHLVIAVIKNFILFTWEIYWKLKNQILSLRVYVCGRKAVDSQELKQCWVSSVSSSFWWLAPLQHRGKSACPFFFFFFLLLSQELLLPHRQLTASDERSLSSPPAHVKALCCKLPFSVDKRTLSLW